MNLVENIWLKWYPWPTEITYDQGSEFIANEFSKYLIEKIWYYRQTKLIRESNLQLNIGNNRLSFRYTCMDI